jgi:hypothetical protein
MMGFNRDRVGILWETMRSNGKTKGHHRECWFIVVSND